MQEVFRDSPQVGKFYETARFTETTGTRWFTTNPVIYVGKYLRCEEKGYGDGCDRRYIFEADDGKEVTVQSDTIDFTTCFREVQVHKAC
jgi:hypothetical protein